MSVCSRSNFVIHLIIKDYLVQFLLFTFRFIAQATTAIYTLSLHDALPISYCRPRTSSRSCPIPAKRPRYGNCCPRAAARPTSVRSEEHTSELQSRENLVCRLLLEKKKNQVVGMYLRFCSNTLY